MNIGFFAGSFSPFTNGHLHIVKTASKFLDKVIVGIGINQNKLPRFDNNDMKVAIEKTLEKEGLTNVEVIIYTTLSVDAAMEHGASVLIRGLRNSMDYEYEEKLGLYKKNQVLNNYLDNLEKHTNQEGLKIINEIREME